MYSLVLRICYAFPKGRQYVNLGMHHLKKLFCQSQLELMVFLWGRLFLSNLSIGLIEQLHCLSTKSISPGGFQKPGILSAAQVL